MECTILSVYGVYIECAWSVYGGGVGYVVELICTLYSRVTVQSTKTFNSVLNFLFFYF